MKANSRYRAEIDGLRAFAVIAVIINHLQKDILPSGFLGVDIFFVISGYVISRSLRERARGRSLIDYLLSFYERRVKRLLPALLFFTILTSLGVWAFSPAPQVSIRTGAAALVGASNLYLLKQSTDYFAQSAELNAFTHTWSLAVEEQFYVLFPCIAWFSGFGLGGKKNGDRNLLYTMLALTCASFLLFLFLRTTNQPASYFLMPARFWEMAMGCIAVVGIEKSPSAVRLLSKIPGIAYLAALSACMLLPANLATYSTTLTVLGTAGLIIRLSVGKCITYKALTHPWMLYIGLASYSLYLWHWGALSIAKWSIGRESLAQALTIIIFALISVASYELIEKPLRALQWFSKPWMTVGAGGLVLAFFTFSFALFNKAASVMLYAGNKDEVAVLNTEHEPINECKDRPDSQKVYVFGDSQADQLRPIRTILEKDCLFSFKVFSYGMYPTIPGQIWSPKSEQRPFTESVLAEYVKISEKYDEALESLGPDDTLILSSRYLCRLHDKCFSVDLLWKEYLLLNERGEEIHPVAALNLFTKKIGFLEEKAAEAGFKILIILPYPELLSHPGVCTKEWFRFPDKTKCRVPEDLPLKRANFISSLRQTIVNSSSIATYDPWQTLCKKGHEATCNSIDYMLFKDANHLSPQGAKIIGKDLATILSNKHQFDDINQGTH